MLAFKLAVAGAAVRARLRGPFHCPLLGLTNKVLSVGLHGQESSRAVFPADRTGWTKPRRGSPYGDSIAGEEWGKGGTGGMAWWGARPGAGSGRVSGAMQR